jgi:4-methyl-5(b-hydroxyethyl)-thiazole monophosphate biosynthesis
MKKVYVFLAEGFEEMEAVTPVDLLRRVQEGVVDVKLVSVTGNKAVTGAHGITYMADLLFEEIEDDADMLVLPGGMPGTTNLMAHEGLAELLVKHYNDRKWVAAICAAPMVLGALGIVMGRWATIYPGMEEYLVGADISKEEVCVSGNVITSKAPGTAIPFALKLIEVLVSESYAEHIKKDIVFQQG